MCHYVLGLSWTLSFLTHFPKCWEYSCGKQVRSLEQCHHKSLWKKVSWIVPHSDAVPDGNFDFVQWTTVSVSLMNYIFLLGMLEADNHFALVDDRLQPVSKLPGELVGAPRLWPLYQSFWFTVINGALWLFE